MSATADRALIVDRPCSTCAHRVRHLGQTYCVRPLRGDASGMYVHTALMFAESCEDERAHGRWVSMILQLCGRRGRYWRAR